MPQHLYTFSDSVSHDQRLSDLQSQLGLTNRAKTIRQCVLVMDEITNLMDQNGLLTVLDESGQRLFIDLKRKR